mgnify:CR=1 FL=1
MKDKISKLKKTVYGTGDVLFGSVVLTMSFLDTVAVHNIYIINKNLVIINFNIIRSSKK